MFFSGMRSQRISTNQAFIEWLQTLYKYATPFPHSSLKKTRYIHFLLFFIFFPLQYNNGASGWTLASWYVTSSSSIESTLVPVTPGDTITGIIKLENAMAVLGTYPIRQHMSNLWCVGQSSIPSIPSTPSTLSRHSLPPLPPATPGIVAD